MGRTFGVIANPSSGKDIRRIVSYADSVGHMEKMNLLLRAIVAAASKGVEKIYFMPDPQGLALAIRKRLKQDGGPWELVEILGFKPEGKSIDTVLAVEEFERLDCRGIIVLGGDGTARDVAQTGTMLPILPISTGTNNVYPEAVEGTIAGLAMGVMAMKPEVACYRRDKRLKIRVNDGATWIALVDVVCSRQLEIASRAVWSPEDVSWLAVTRATPASIGLSSIVGQWEYLSPEDPKWIVFQCGENGEKRMAPIIPGRMIPIGNAAMETYELTESMEWEADHGGTLALDGERMVRFHKGDRISIRSDFEGPIRIQVEETLIKELKSR